MTIAQKPTRSHAYKGKYSPMDQTCYKVMVIDFKNTPLEPYVVEAAKFFMMDVTKQFNSILPQAVRNRLLNFTEESLQFAKFIREIKKGCLKGKGWSIQSKDDIASVYNAVEDIFLDKLEEIFMIFEEFGESSAIQNAIIEEWKDIFQDYPCRESFEFEDKELDEEGNEIEYRDSHLSLRELDYTIKVLEKYYRIAKKLTIDLDRKFVTRFLEHMLDAGIPRSRKVYFELYRLLDYFNYIPDEVRHTHKTTTSQYNESNYIKSLVTTIIKNKNKL